MVLVGVTRVQDVRGEDVVREGCWRVRVRLDVRVKKLFLVAENLVLEDALLNDLFGLIFLLQPLPIHPF